MAGYTVQYHWNAKGLKLHEISGSHGSEYKDKSLLGYE
jgi:hypothetical protein